MGQCFGIICVIYPDNNKALRLMGSFRFVLVTLSSGSCENHTIQSNVPLQLHRCGGEGFSRTVTAIIAEHHFLLLILSYYSVGSESLNLLFHTQGAEHFMYFFLYFLLPSRTKFATEVQNKSCSSVESAVATQPNDIKDNQNISAASFIKA